MHSALKEFFNSFFKLFISSFTNYLVSTIWLLSVNFTYGELDSSFPDYMRPPDGKYVTGDSVNFVLPSHITFVASSSYDGDNFAGAVGSTLLVDNLELLYLE